MPAICSLLYTVYRLYKVTVYFPLFSILKKKYTHTHKRRDKHIFF